LNKPETEEDIRYSPDVITRYDDGGNQSTMSPLIFRNLKSETEYALFMVASTDNPNPHDVYWTDIRHIFVSTKAEIELELLDGNSLAFKIGNLALITVIALLYT